MNQDYSLAADFLLPFIQNLQILLERATVLKLFSSFVHAIPPGLSWTSLLSSAWYVFSS